MNTPAIRSSYCDYHPLAPATYSCESCHTFNCDNCVDEGEHNIPNCFTCAKPVDHLGAVNSATPFWRRLEESFRYPLKGSAPGLILVVSLLSSLAMYLPFGFVWSLMIAGSFLKYCFSCLENTARGRLIPPDISEGYGGGLTLLAKMLFMLLVAGFVVFGAYRFLGPQIAALLGFLMIVALPAVIIMYGMTEHVLESLNPLNLLRLIAAIGLPYGLLLAFIMIMSASVGVISEVLGSRFALMSGILQSAISNYYSVVMFHIMGYMIFQYQGELGFTAREDHGEVKAPRPARERMAAHIDIALKNGDYNLAVSLFRAGLKKYPEDRDFNRRYFEFLCATGRNVAAAADRYLNYLIRSDQEHQLQIIYKRVLQLDKDYQPASAALRHRLASACKQGGDPRTAVRLLNGLHRQYQDYPRLAEAYELMADALEDIPHHQTQAAKCRGLVEQLKQRQASRGVSDAEGQGQTASVRPSRAATKSQREAEKKDSGPGSELPPIEFHQQLSE